MATSILAFSLLPYFYVHGEMALSYFGEYDAMTLLFSHKDLKKDMLSYEALALLSEFALIWYTSTGELINPDAEESIVPILRRANRSESRRLQSIYLHLRAELSSKIQSSIPHCDAMLADQLMYSISEGLSDHPTQHAYS